MFFLGRNRRFDVTYAGKRTGPARFLPEGTYDITCAREFRYDGARQHYLNRALNAADLLLGIISMDDNAEAYWSDYDGDDIYDDLRSTPARLRMNACPDPVRPASMNPSWSCRGERER